MNTVFLTSQASEVLERIVELLPRKPAEYQVLLIPTASKVYPSAPWLDTDRAKLISLGFSVTDLDLEGASIEKVRSAVDASDIIFVGGGNTFYLLEHAKKSGFLEAVRDAVSQGKRYIGSSAGSVLAAPDISYVELLDDPSVAALPDTKALGLVEFRILPHYGNPKYEKLQTQILNEYQDTKSRIVPVKDNEFLNFDGSIR